MSQVSIIDIEGNHPQIPTEFIADIGSAIPIANQLEILGDTVPAGVLPVYTTGAGNTITTNVQISQAIAASNALNVGLSAFDSADFTVDANGFVSLASGSVQSIDSVNVDSSTVPGTDPVLPTALGVITVTGGQIAAGLTGNVIRTNSLAANTYTIEVQRASAQAVSTIGSNGVSHFDSAAFDVDANGFVQLNGGGVAATSFDVQANTAPGTDPVVPTAAGVVTVNGAAVANHSVVLESRSRAANAYNLEIQYATSSAATDATKSGVAHFRTSDFTVDANAFVILSTTGAGKTITGDTGGALSPTANNWNILGGPGVTTSGSGSTLTINSVVFTDTAAATLAVDNGYFATAAGTYPMPATAAQGELIQVVCDTSGAVVLDCPALNFIRIGSLITSSGGTVTSTAQGDSLTLRYRLSALTWECTSCIGTWLVA